MDSASKTGNLAGVGLTPLLGDVCEKTKTEQMLYKALHRVHWSIPEKADLVFDIELQEWFDDYRQRMPRDEAAEWESHELLLTIMRS